MYFFFFLIVIQIDNLQAIIIQLQAENLKANDNLTEYRILHEENMKKLVREVPFTSYLFILVLLNPFIIVDRTANGAIRTRKRRNNTAACKN